MYVSIASRTGGRKYLSIVHGYRDENGKVRKKTIRSLGYLDELEKEYEDPIAHFKAVAKEMDTQRKQETYGYDLCINQQEKLSVGTDNMKNFRLCRPQQDLPRTGAGFFSEKPTTPYRRHF